MSSSAIGIDLGTTYSCVGVWKDGQVTIIPNDQGNRTTPSYVSFNGNERIVGDGAKMSCARNVHNTVFDAKRLIGRNYNDPDTQSDIKHFPFTVVDKGNQPMIEVDYMGERKQFCPEEISSMVLGYMKKTAEAYMGKGVTDAVITVPAYFNDSQRQATKDAATLAGLNTLRIINEPTAAAIAYGLNKTDEGEKHVLVFDMGGGTFDVSLLNIADGVFEVLATAGDTHLGGEDFDNLIVELLATDFMRKNKGVGDIRKNAKAMRRLRTAAERAKRTLSSSTQAAIEIDSLFEGVDYSYALSRSRFERTCDHLFNKSMDPIQKVLRDADIGKSAVDEIVMVGGSTRIPRIQELVSQMFNGKKLAKDINPDEAVAYGATVQAAILAGEAENDEKLDNILLLDVNPISLGIAVNGGEFNVLIPAQKTIPTAAKRTYSTASDNQKRVGVSVYQGERKLVMHNHKLGEFILDGIPPMRRGEPEIDVEFNLDANGILTVTAVEKSTGKSNKIEITNSTGRLSKEEIEAKLEEAKQYAEQDELNLKRIQAKNRLDGIVYSMNRAAEGAPNEEAKSTLESLAHDTQQWMDDNPDAELEEYEKKCSKLEEAMQKLTGSAANGASNQDAGMPGASPGPTVEEID